MSNLSATALAQEAAPGQDAAPEAQPAEPQEALPQWVILPGHEEDILASVAQLVGSVTPPCQSTAIRVEATQIVASLTCGTTEHTLYVTAEAPSSAEESAGVVESERDLWARVTPAPTGSAAGLEDALGDFLESLPDDLFVAPGGGAGSRGVPMWWYGAGGGAALLLVVLTVGVVRKRRSAPPAA